MIGFSSLFSFWNPREEISPTAPAIILAWLAIAACSILEARAGSLCGQGGHALYGYLLRTRTLYRW